METPKERVLNITLSRENFMPRFLEMLNGVAKLTQRERLVFLSLCEIYAKHKNVDILTQDNRKEVSRKVKLTSYNISNTIAKLKEKSAILFDENTSTYYLNPVLVPNDEVTEIKFVINYI